MKLRISYLIPTMGLLLAASSSADTIVLKNGERLDARITKETEDSYVLDVRVTKSIRDEKTISKAEVAEIIPEKLDETAFETIKGFVPAPDFLSADEYSRRIALIGKFLKEYPKSPKAADAETMSATLKTELAAVAEGGVKMEGKIISGEDYAKNAYELDALVLEKRIREAAARGDILGALRGIDRMESDYKLTNPRRALMPLKNQLLQSYKTYIDELSSTYEERVNERNKGLATMKNEDRANAERAQEEELAAVKAAYAAGKEKQVRWFDVHPFSWDVLEVTRETINSELTNTIDDNGKDAGKIYRNVLRIIGEQSDPDIMREVYSKAVEVEIPSKYTSRIQAAAKAKGVDVP